MADENSTTVDLWGNEVFCLPRKRGRPPFEWTEENANKISMLLSLGWSNDRIASCVKDPRTGKCISVPTLKRYFRAELGHRDVARDQLTAWQIDKAFRAAEAGNVGAMRVLDKLIDKNDMMLAERSIAGKDNGKDQADVKLGKKQTSAIAAKDADQALDDQLEAEAQRSVRH